MMDAYAQGQTARLSQSYVDQQGLQSTGFVYDNSLVILAHLLRGRQDDIFRAEILGGLCCTPSKPTLPLTVECAKHTS
jgi:hypothetical protein